jgi:hypothetical protein
MDFGFNFQLQVQHAREKITCMLNLELKSWNHFIHFLPFYCTYQCIPHLRTPSPTTRMMTTTATQGQWAQRCVRIFLFFCADAIGSEWGGCSPPHLFSDTTGEGTTPPCLFCEVTWGGETPPPLPLHIPHLRTPSPLHAHGTRRRHWRRIDRDSGHKVCPHISYFVFVLMWWPANGEGTSGKRENGNLR